MTFFILFADVDQKRREQLKKDTPSRSGGSDSQRSSRLNSRASCSSKNVRTSYITWSCIFSIQSESLHYLCAFRVEPPFKVIITWTIQWCPHPGSAPRSIPSKLRIHPKLIVHLVALRIVSVLPPSYRDTEAQIFSPAIYLLSVRDNTKAFRTQHRRRTAVTCCRNTLIALRRRNPLHREPWSPVTSLHSHNIAITHHQREKMKRRDLPLVGWLGRRGKATSALILKIYSHVNGSVDSVWFICSVAHSPSLDFHHSVIHHRQVIYKNNVRNHISFIIL